MAQQTAPKRTIEVFRVGSHTTSAGKQLTFNAAQVAAIAANYDPIGNPAPVVIGHPDVDAPALGWASSFAFSADDQKLRADLDQLMPEFVACVKAGNYKKVSMALFPPDHPSNPTPGNYYPRHIGFLGGAAPAIPGLKPVHFDDGGSPDIVIEFDAPDFSDPKAADSIGAQIVEYLKTVIGIGEKPGRTLFSARAPANSGDLEMSQTEKEKLAQLEQENATLKANQTKAAAKARLGSAVAFCATLVTAKKLAPKDSAPLAAVIAVLPETEIEFASEGGQTAKESPLAVLKRVLEAKSPILSTNAKSDPPPVAARGLAHARFSTSEGHTADPAQLAVYNSAKQYQAEHKVNFRDAVAAVTAAADAAAQG